VALEESAQLVSQERLDQREEQEGSVGLEGQVVLGAPEAWVQQGSRARQAQRAVQVEPERQANRDNRVVLAGQEAQEGPEGQGVLAQQG